MDKIKACPFCGEEAKLFTRRGEYGRFCFVECICCGGRSSIFSAKRSEEMAHKKAITAWNARYGDVNG